MAASAASWEIWRDNEIDEFWSAIQFIHEEIMLLQEEQKETEDPSGDS
jgi:hypothetical protein